MKLNFSFPTLFGPGFQPFSMFQQHPYMQRLQPDPVRGRTDSDPVENQLVNELSWLDRAINID